jgi:hypothetical protein
MYGSRPAISLTRCRYTITYSINMVTSFLQWYKRAERSFKRAHPLWRPLADPRGVHIGTIVKIFSIRMISKITLKCTCKTKRKFITFGKVTINSLPFEVDNFVIIPYLFR